MNSRELARYLVLGGVLTGIAAGSQAQSSQLVSHNSLTSATAVAADANKKAPEKHACKGLNSCKSQGNCKAGDNGCSGKNSCKGKGGCASKEYKHDCAGKNACKGQGQGGKNDCKGKSGCAVPPKAS
jgi:hypothetical protein